MQTNASIKSWIPWGFAIFFCATSVFLGLKLLAANKRIELAKTIMASSDAADKELRDSIQANQQAAQDKQNAQDKISAVCGIYYFDNPQRAIHQKIDIRSDGTAFFSRMAGTFQPEKMNWSLDNETVSVKGISFNGKQFFMQFKIEQDDLIDSDGNRWLHIR